MSSRSFKTVKEKRSFLRKRTKDDKKLSRWFMGGLVFAALYHFLIEPKVIGSDLRYDLFAFWIPLFLGMIFFGWWRRDFLKTQFVTSKGFFVKAFIVGFYLVQGIFVSMISFRQVAKMGIDLVQAIKARNAPHEVLEYRIVQFMDSRAKSTWTHVYFDMNGKEEGFSIRDRYIRDYLDEDPDDYKVRIEVQKGLWETYVVNNWEILEK